MAARLARAFDNSSFQFMCSMEAGGLASITRRAAAMSHVTSVAAAKATSRL
jgi:hypothetical protein